MSKSAREASSSTNITPEQSKEIVEVSQTQENQPTIDLPQPDIQRSSAPRGSSPVPCFSPSARQHSLEKRIRDASPRRHTVDTASVGRSDHVYQPHNRANPWTAWCDPWVTFCDDLHDQELASARRSRCYGLPPDLCDVEEGKCPHARRKTAKSTARASFDLVIQEETADGFTDVGLDSTYISEQAALLPEEEEKPQIAPAGSNSWFTTTINLLMNTLGSTVLFLPKMYAQLGWILTPILLTIAAVLSYFSGHILSETIDTYQERGDCIIKFGDIAASALGPGTWITIITDWFGHLTIFCSLIILLNFWTQVMFYMFPGIPYRAWMYLFHFFRINSRSFLFHVNCKRKILSELILALTKH